MSPHPDRQALIGHVFGLLDGEDARGVARHLEACEPCRSQASRLAAAEAALLPPRPRPPGPRSLREVLSSSPAAPISAMALAWAGAALLSEAAEAVSLSLLLAGGLAVVAWLSAVVSRAERSFRAVESVAGSATDDDRVRLEAGVALSVAHELRSARARISTVLVAALVLALVGGAAVLVASELAPTLAASVTSRRPLLLPAGLTAGLLLAATLWTLVRLARLARAAGAWARR